MKNSLLLCSLGVAALPVLFAPGDVDPAPRPAAGAGGVVTLYAHDDLLSAFNFRTGAAGASIEAGERVLDGAHMVFGVFAEDMLSFGFIRREQVNIIDLGDFEVPGLKLAKDRSPALPMSVFHTLFREGGHFAYVGPNGKVLRYKAAQRILDPLPPQGLYHIEPKLGHTYLVRYHRQKAGSPEEYAKFRVIDLRPGRSLTIRWAGVAGA